MKNAITTFSSTGFNPFPFYSGNPKYRNVKLVTSTDAGYRAYKYQFIINQRAGHSADYVPQETTALYKVSLDVEHVVRKWFGSDFERILSYEVYANGKYHQHYRELDCVKAEPDGSITLCEIKASSNNSSNKAIAQLQISAEILRLNYKRIKLVTINVDMGGIAGTSDFAAHSNDACNNYKLSADGIGYYAIILAPNDIKSLADECCSFRLDLFAQACEEAIQCVSNRRAKNMERLQRKSELHKDMKPQPTTFGFLLQSVLEKSPLSTLMAQSA